MKHRLAVIFLSLFFLYSMKMVAQESNTRENLTYKIESGRVLTSSDAKATWSVLSNSPDNLMLVAWHPNQPMRLVAAAKNTVYFCDAIKKQWMVTFVRGGEFVPTEIKYSMKNQAEVWMVCRTSKEGEDGRSDIFYSKNGGVTWDRVQSLLKDAVNIQLDPDDTRKYWYEPSTPRSEDK